MNQAIKVVARYVDGRIVKGTTHDFFPTKDAFHVHELEGGGAESVRVERDSLKALFFVKSLSGDPGYTESLEPREAAAAGRKMIVRFEDGETLAGFTSGYNPSRPGFFLFPFDEESNNERIFIVNKAVRSVEWL